MRRVVNGALEVERAEKRIGASLQAAPVVHIADGDTRALVQTIDFADFCITSAIEVSGEAAPANAFTLPEIDGVAVVPAQATGEKCQRCWKILPEVGTLDDPHVCQRCHDAVSA